MRTRQPDPGWTSTALVIGAWMAPLAWGLYRTIADWPTGALTLGAVVAMYIVALTASVILEYIWVTFIIPRAVETPIESD